MKITYIGHATVLLEIQGVRLLTDPNFDTSLGYFLRRVSPPGIALDELPVLDAILLTHGHADHLSFATLNRLPRQVPILAPKAIAKWLNRKGYQGISLESGSVNVLGDSTVRIHADRATHEGSRYGFDRWRSAANMYLIETHAESVFFAGDTALTPGTHVMPENILAEGTRRLDVALLPIGYAPVWKPGFRRGHLTGSDALTLFRKLDARYLIPYHWGTFHHVTATAYDAIDRLRNELTRFEGADRVRILEPGESLSVRPASSRP